MVKTTYNISSVELLTKYTKNEIYTFLTVEMIKSASAGLPTIPCIKIIGLYWLDIWSKDIKTIKPVIRILPKFFCSYAHRNVSYWLLPLVIGKKFKMFRKPKTFGGKFSLSYMYAIDQRCTLKLNRICLIFSVTSFVRI